MPNAKECAVSSAGFPIRSRHPDYILFTLVCAACEDPINTYEDVVWKLEDGDTRAEVEATARRTQNPHVFIHMECY